MGARNRIPALVRIRFLRRPIDSLPTVAFRTHPPSPRLRLDRIENCWSAATYIVFRQLLRALRGQTESPGSFSDATFDEARHLATLGANRGAEAYLHTYSALTAALFDDGASLIHHAAAAMDLRGHLDGFYPIALAYVLQGLVVARRLRDAAASVQAALGTEFDTCRMWLAQRTADAPGNYLHLVHLFDAEIAWASGDYWG